MRSCVSGGTRDSTHLGHPGRASEEDTPHVPGRVEPWALGQWCPHSLMRGQNGRLRGIPLSHWARNLGERSSLSLSRLGECILVPPGIRSVTSWLLKLQGEVAPPSQQ